MTTRWMRPCHLVEGVPCLSDCDGDHCIRSRFPLRVTEDAPKTIDKAKRRHRSSNSGEDADRQAGAEKKRISLTPQAIEALPSLADLQIRPEILEAAEDLVSGADAPGVTDYVLEVLVRLIVAADRGLV